MALSLFFFLCFLLSSVSLMFSLLICKPQQPDSLQFSVTLKRIMFTLHYIFSNECTYIFYIYNINVYKICRYIKASLSVWVNKVLYLAKMPWTRTTRCSGSSPVSIKTFGDITLPSVVLIAWALKLWLLQMLFIPAYKAHKILRETICKTKKRILTCQDMWSVSNDKDFAEEHKKLCPNSDRLHGYSKFRLQSQRRQSCKADIQPLLYRHN